MRGALLIFIAMVAIGIVLYLIDLLYYRRKKGLPPVDFQPKSQAKAQSHGQPKDQGGAPIAPVSTSHGDNAGTPVTPAGEPDEESARLTITSTSPNGQTRRAPEGIAEEPEVCCGMHMVCEKTNLSPLSAEIIYYDDEELDRFRGRDPKTYTPEETEEFRDVLMTLLPQDVAGWSRSIQLREIPLPPDVRDELLLIVSELRTS